MALKVSIDGALHTGNYRVECECGEPWMGQGAEENGRYYSPALPIAEVIVHFKMQHPDEQLDMTFTERFSDWLVNYWQRENVRQHARQGPTRAGLRVTKPDTTLRGPSW